MPEVSSRSFRKRESQAFLHARQVLMRTIDCVRAIPCELEGTLGAPAALRRGIVQDRADQPLLFEPFERRVDRADAHVAPGSFRDFPANPHAVGIASQAQNSQQHEVLKLAEYFALWHFYILEKIYWAVKLFVTESFHWVQFRGFDGGPDPEEHTDRH